MRSGVSESRFFGVFVDPSPEEENFGLAIIPSRWSDYSSSYIRYIKSSAGSYFVGNVRLMSYVYITINYIENLHDRGSCL